MCLHLSEVYGARTLLYADYKVLYGSGSILNIFCEVHVLFIVKTVNVMMCLFQAVTANHKCCARRLSPS